MSGTNYHIADSTIVDESSAKRTYIDPAEDATRQSVQFGVASFRIEGTI
jgi:hypothetical protein